MWPLEQCLMLVQFCPSLLHVVLGWNLNKLSYLHVVSCIVTRHTNFGTPSANGLDRKQPRSDVGITELAGSKTSCRCNGCWAPVPWHSVYRAIKSGTHCHICIQVVSRNVPCGLRYLFLRPSLCPLGSLPRVWLPCHRRTDTRPFK